MTLAGIIGGVLIAAITAVFAASDGPDITKNLSLWQAAVTLLAAGTTGAILFFVGRSALAKATDDAKAAATKAAQEATASMEAWAGAEVHRRELAEQEAAAHRARAETLAAENEKLHQKTDLSPMLEILTKKWESQDDRLGAASEEHKGIIKAIERLSDAHSDEVEARHQDQLALRDTLERLNGSIDRVLNAPRPQPMPGLQHPATRSGEPQHPQYEGEGETP